MTKLRNIKGLLLDLEGVIYSGNKIIDGSIETIDKLRSKVIDINKDFEGRN